MGKSSLPGTEQAALPSSADGCCQVFFFALIYFCTTHQITQYCHGPMAKAQSTKIHEKTLLTAGSGAGLPEVGCN